MAIPTTALVWAEPMDPYDVVDYSIDCSALLDASESIASYTIVPSSESVLLGLQTGTGEYANSRTGKVITTWFSIESSKQDSIAFSGPGATLPAEISITTTSTPPRKRQRTCVVKVLQR
jgi:hypothetical protein